jgi:hypothetical protein
MEFVAPYPEVVAEDKVIDNVVALLSNAQFQSGALRWANGGEDLEPYKLVSASAVPREAGSYPYLLIDDIVTDGLKDTGQYISGTLHFGIFQALAEPATDAESSDRLMREAIRRNLAVEMMLRAKAARAVIFNGFNVGGRAKVLVIRRDASGTIPGQPSYRRFPSVAVAINFMEGP